MGADAGNEVRDIRDVAPDEHWAHFAEAWRALQSYTYLGKGTPHMDAGVERETMPLRHDMRNTTGGVMAAPLAILAPEPWWLDDDCVPAPVTMSYAVVDPAHDVARLEVVREVVAIGRQLGFSRSHIVDADDHSRLVAVSSGSGVSLGDVPGGFEPVDNPVTELLDSPDLPSLRDAFGMIEGPDGSVQIPSVTPALASPHGALHLGPINIAMEAAATGELTRTLGGDRFQVEHWSVLLVKPGQVGPFEARAEIAGGPPDRPAVEVTMTDAGRGDRVIATATATFHAVDDRSAP